MVNACSRNTDGELIPYHVAGDAPLHVLGTAGAVVVPGMTHVRETVFERLALGRVGAAADGLSQCLHGIAAHHLLRGGTGVVVVHTTLLRLAGSVEARHLAGGVDV